MRCHRKGLKTTEIVGVPRLFEDLPLKTAFFLLQLVIPDQRPPPNPQRRTVSVTEDRGIRYSDPPSMFVSIFQISFPSVVLRSFLPRRRRHVSDKFWRSEAVTSANPTVIGALAHIPRYLLLVQVQSLIRCSH